MPNTVAVAAALICQGGRFLIGQRPAHKARGLLWEFVGGKLEPGETGPEALSRECREELGVTVAVGPLYARMEKLNALKFKSLHYTNALGTDLTVELLLYQAAIAAGTPQLLEHTALHWVAVDELEQYAFCPADAPILERLRAEGLPPEFRPAS